MKDTILDKDTIAVTIGDDHAFNCTAVTIGRTGEHSVSQLEITIPDELCSFWAFLDFKKPRGELVKTERLSIVNNKIEYDIPNGLLDENGNLEVQLVLQAENGEVWKSAVKKFVVLKSIDATEDIPEKEDFITEAQRILNETEETLERVLDVREGDAPAIREQVNGNPVRIDDISPLDHTLKVEARCKNLVPYPHINTTRTINGITFTDNGDGTITANGTATAAAIHQIVSNVSVPKDIYTVSGSPAGSAYGVYRIGIAFSCDGKDDEIGTPAEGSVLEIDLIRSMYLIVYAGQTVNNLVFKPQIELGRTATAYEPYRESVTVTRCGKNLIPYPHAHTTKTENGITFTDNGDGTITVNGTATKGAQYNMVGTLTAGTYTYSSSNITSYSEARMQIRFLDNTVDKYATAGQPSACFSVDGLRDYTAYIYITEGQTYNNVTFSPQIELGTVATPFEPYRGETYTADGAGDVDGITSIYPTTTLIADDGVIITAEYNADTKKYIDRKFAELAALIANE